MPKLGKLNLDAIQPPAQLPAGKYTARLVDVVDGQSRSNKEMWTWSWEIIGGEFSGKQIKSFTLVEAGENLISLRQHLEAFGFSGQLSGVDTDKLIGKSAILVLVKGKRKDPNTNKEIEVTNVQSVHPYKKAAPVAAAPVNDDDDEDEDLNIVKKAKAKPAPVDDDEDEEVTKSKTEDTDEDEPETKPSRKAKKVDEEEDDELPILD